MKPTLLLYPAGDIAAAKKLFGVLLGTEPYADAPYYVGFRVDDLEIGLAGTQSAGAVAYWDVDDLEGRLQELVDAGWQAEQAITPVGGGMRVATVKDANGNVVGLRSVSGV